MMLAKFFIPVLIYAAFLSCSQTNEGVGNELKSFTIENVDSDYNLVFNFPRSFVSIKEMNNIDHLDTTDINLNWIFNVQYENADLDCFYVSTKWHSALVIVNSSGDVNMDKYILEYVAHPRD